MRPEAELAAAPFQLLLPRNPLSGRGGSRLGAGHGASLEFMDYRDYLPGDDLRHVDWRSYARTDKLKIRLFREEISPDVEIIADYSLSMGVSQAKERALRDLVCALAYWTRKGGGTPKLFLAGADRIDDPETQSLLGGKSDELLPRQALRPGTLRILLSDFLLAGAPGPRIRSLAARSAYEFIIQLLDPWELNPDEEGPRTLIDIESDERLSLVLDHKCVARYKTRLQRLIEGVRDATRSIGGTHALVRAREPARMFRDDLLAQGILEPC